MSRIWTSAILPGVILSLAIALGIGQATTRAADLDDFGDNAMPQPTWSPNLPQIIHGRYAIAPNNMPPPPNLAPIPNEAPLQPAASRPIPDAGHADMPPCPPIPSGGEPPWSGGYFPPPKPLPEPDGPDIDPVIDLDTAQPPCPPTSSGGESPRPDGCIPLILMLPPDDRI